jgi:hypothetical protein
VSIGNSVTAIGRFAFEGCTSLASVTMGNSLTRIGDGGFYSCNNLTSIAVGSGVTSIGQIAFGSCTRMTNISIPNTVKTIESAAFSYCTSLTGVYCWGNAPTAWSDLFLNSTNAIVYYLPGTTGWGPTFGGRPTALWLLRNPLILDGSVGVQTGRLCFTISWATIVPVTVETCTDLITPEWNAIATVRLTNGVGYFSDADWANYPRRFYRVRWP